MYCNSVDGLNRSRNKGIITDRAVALVELLEQVLQRFIVTLRAGQDVVEHVDHFVFRQMQD